MLKESINRAKFILSAFNENGQINIDAKAGKTAVILDSKTNSARMTLRKDHFELIEFNIRRTQRL